VHRIAVPDQGSSLFDSARNCLIGETPDTYVFSGDVFPGAQAMKRLETEVGRSADEDEDTDERACGHAGPVRTGHRKDPSDVRSPVRLHPPGRRMHWLRWRDAFDVLVRWRQISEPFDPVFFIDRLTPQAFQEGFGLQTPLISGQQRNPRYYSQFPRVFRVFKALASRSLALEPTQRKQLLEAEDPVAVYQVTKRDFWVSTECFSVRFPPGHAANAGSGSGAKIEYVRSTMLDRIVEQIGSPKGKIAREQFEAAQQGASDGGALDEAGSGAGAVASQDAVVAKEEDEEESFGQDRPVSLKVPNLDDDDGLVSFSMDSEAIAQERRNAEHGRHARPGSSSVGAVHMPGAGVAASGSALGVGTAAPPKEAIASASASLGRSFEGTRITL